MSRKKTKWMQCAATCSDGSRCTRSARFEDRLCHIHLDKQKRAVGMAPPDPNHFVPSIRTPREVLERIANNDKHPQQVQAARALIDLDREHGADPRGQILAQQVPNDDEMWLRATDEQRRTMADMVQHINSLRAVVMTQPLRPPTDEDNPPAEYLERERKAAAQPAPIASVAPEEQESDDEVEEEEEEAQPGDILTIIGPDDEIQGTFVVPPRAFEDEDEDFDG